MYIERDLMLFFFLIILFFDEFKHFISFPLQIFYLIIDVMLFIIVLQVCSLDSWMNSGM